MPVATAKEQKVDEAKIRLKDVRISFAHVFTPQPGKLDKVTGKMSEPRYNCSFLIDKDRPDFDDVMELFQAASDYVKLNHKAFGADRSKWPKLKAERICLRDGDEENWDGYENHMYVSCGAREDSPPTIVDRDRSELTKANGGPKKIYSGAYVNATIRLWVQDNEDGGKRINAELKGIQFLRKGDAFAGNRPIDPNEEFADISEEGDVEDMEDNAPAVRAKPVVKKPVVVAKRISSLI